MKKAKPQNAPQGGIAHEQTDARSESRSHGAVNPFDAAVSAFEHRFEADLTTRWQSLEHTAALTACDPSTSLGEKRSAVNGFFEDAEEAIRTVVHEYFPKLLQVATAKRQYLGNESPLVWTKAQVLRQVCTFLGVDETFDSTSAPRDDSRLVAAAAQIAIGVGWPDEIPTGSVLPGWLSTRWAWRQAAGAPIPEDDAESLAPLSRAETLEWIKHREHSIMSRLGLQIEREGWDGIIEDVSVLDADRPPDPSASSRAEARSNMPDDDVGSILPPLPQAEVERTRAETVTRVLKELAAVRSQMVDEGSYDRLKAEKSNFILFKECDKDHELKTLLLNIKSHHQRKSLRFAKQVAASYNNLKLNTIEKAWDKYNPNRKPRKHSELGQRRNRITVPTRA